MDKKTEHNWARCNVCGRDDEDKLCKSCDDGDNYIRFIEGEGKEDK